jgi:aspartyl-tRNA(Asn)/glutamyl-tRNA(Gln) amidotransferase subunit C
MALAAGSRPVHNGCGDGYDLPPLNQDQPIIMALDPVTIRRIAKLARIRVEDAEVATLQTELNGILGWIEQLQDVNVDGVEPMAGGAARGAALAPREDEVTDGGQLEKILANAPERDGAFFTVPKVVE